MFLLWFVVWCIRCISLLEENVLMLVLLFWILWSLCMSLMVLLLYIFGVFWDIDEILMRFWWDVDGYFYFYVFWMGFGGCYFGDLIDWFFRDDDFNLGVYIM